MKIMLPEIHEKESFISKRYFGRGSVFVLLVSEITASVLFQGKVFKHGTCSFISFYQIRFGDFGEKSGSVDTMQAIICIF